jgi:O-succinylhomoserine sulfhydrylase
MSAFNAWVLHRSMETLALRMKAHSESAFALATWLEQHPSVGRVFYPGLPTHPQHALAMRQQSSGGAIVSFELKANDEAQAQERAFRLVNAVTLFSRTGNLGDTRSIITHPASTTHGRITEEARARAGIRQSLIRLAVGLETLEDLKADLSQGL